ncbi:MAG TPA: hypothetical protein VMT15_05130 [Bryobacteraceae bacterium]|nr:hypothetical protein [Bryobacteraceae bacterium]
MKQPGATSQEKKMIDIDREHPEYLALKHVWRRYRDLYIGGERLKLHAQEYLLPRQREPGDVYTERLSRVFYENYIGSIVDWYAATLFRREPVVTFGGRNGRAREFFAGLMDEVDLQGTGLSEFFRRQFVESLITGASYVLVDFPRTEAKAGTRAEEDATGASRAYLVAYSSEDVINWNLDEQGNFDWVVIRTKVVKTDRMEDAEWRTETRWAYYDKQTFRVYSKADDATRLVDEGTHALAKLDRVPLFDLRIPEGLWMLNRAGLLQLEHFNKSNALSWALTMGLFAMPVVYSDRDWNQMVGESYYIQLSPEDKFGWTEPEGKVFQIAQDNLTRLQEEIYRVCYLAQAGGSLTAGGMQSGISKQLDFSITQEVLRAYGDAMKDLIRRVLTSIEAAREDGIEISVTGMDEFDITDFGTELSDAQALLGLGVESPTLKKEIFKKLALKYLSDSRQDVKDQIVAEIEGN